MPALQIIMQTEHAETGASIETAIDEEGRLYVNGKRVATELDLGKAAVPIWLAAISALMAAVGSVAQAIPAWLSLCR